VFLNRRNDKLSLKLKHTQIEKSILNFSHDV